MTKCLILGGGVSGLALAWRLAEQGMPAEVLEASAQVGGLAGTLREGPYALDFGPHSFFTEDEPIREFVLGLFDPPLAPAARTVKFLYQGRLLDYPLTPAGVLWQMGFLNGLRALGSFIKAASLRGGRRPTKQSSKKQIASLPFRQQPDGPAVFGRAEARNDESVEDWARANFGDYLYRTFFKPYTEQFWHIPCADLSARAIPSHTRMGFLQTLRHLVRRRLPRNPSLIDREKLPTYYPPSGYGEIADRIAAKAQAAGARIHLGARVMQVERHDGAWKVTYLEQGMEKTIYAPQIVSTLPLPIFVRMLRPAPPPDVLAAAEKLDFRPFVFLGMVTENQDVLPAGYMYVLDRPYNRITEMNKFSPATSPEGENIIAVEIPCLRSGPVWEASQEELFEMCAGALAADGILTPGDVKKLLLVKAGYAYPIYRKNYAPHLKLVLDYVRGLPGLETLGRSGEFMYMDADKCIRRAFDCADVILRAQPEESRRSFASLRMTNPL